MKKDGAKKHGVVVTAAGYGGFPAIERTGLVPYPKVLEKVDGKPMVIRSIEAARDAGLHICAVVANPVSGARVRFACGHAGITAHHEVQPEQTGPADAVMMAASWLAARGVENFLTIAADMPLWRSQTIAELLEVHMADQTVVSMGTVARSPQYPEFESYGRVVRDPAGHIVRVVSPRYAKLTEEEEAAT